MCTYALIGNRYSAISDKAQNITFEGAVGNQPLTQILFSMFTG